MSQLVDDALLRINGVIGPNLSPVTLAVAVIVVPLVLVVLKKAFIMSLDPREPPVVRPTIPFIGHILGLANESGSYFSRLYRQHRFPICTLPMLNGKMYVVNSPGLIGAAAKNRDLSFTPFALEFSQNLLGIEPQQFEHFAADGWMDGMTQTIHASLTGEKLRSMKAACYRELAKTISAEFVLGSEPIVIPHLYGWLLDRVPLAFTAALFGEKNPFDSEAIKNIWLFDEQISILATDFFPRILARKAYAARIALWKTARPYYEAGHWKRDDVAAIIKDRAEKVTGEGLPWTTLANTEINIAWASVTNTVPDLFWLLTNLFTRPRYLERFRAEVADVTTIIADPKSGQRLGRIDAGGLDKKPFAMALYWETHRMYNEILCNRRAIKDTTIRDPTSGREYFLEKGINVQWATGVSHQYEDVWGADAGEFRPERWIDAADEKAQRTAMFPFGGGKNLCPGKSFAISESLGLMAALAAGFDIEGVTVPKSKPTFVGGAMRQPDFGRAGDPSITLRRRKGLEDVTWSFVIDD